MKHRVLVFFVFSLLFTPNRLTGVTDLADGLWNVMMYHTRGARGGGRARSLDTINPLSPGGFFSLRPIENDRENRPTVASHAR